MILYLDTNALIKLYVEEEGADTVRRMREGTRVVATSRLACAEARAALARAQREGRICMQDYRQVVEDLDRDWESYFVLEVTEGLVRQAGDLAERHALRACDALHLASALLLHERVRLDITFLCFDERLEEAAQAVDLGM
jgi:predicted nucleic acid-binding protein